eukprot:scaffold43768_cov16-Tisochrysis_lutea.AAC.1
MSLTKERLRVRLSKECPCASSTGRKCQLSPARVRVLQETQNAGEPGKCQPSPARERVLQPRIWRARHCTLRPHITLCIALTFPISPLPRKPDVGTGKKLATVLASKLFCVFLEQARSWSELICMFMYRQEAG